MKSFEPAYLAALRIPTRLFSVIRQLGEHKGKQALYHQQAPEILERMRKSAVIHSTISSNRLEGITAGTRRIKDLMAEKTAPANRSEAEIAGYRDVLNTIHRSHRSIPFTDGIVLQFHRDLMKYAGKEGGRWKSTDNTITEALPDGTRRFRFEPVPPFLTPEYMESLHRDYRRVSAEGEWDPLILIPFYIIDFLCIHPFLDGNGRMARLLTVLLLYHNGYEAGRYISLERIIEGTRESYYDTLYRSSQGWHEGRHDIWPWAEYFLGVVLAAYADFQERFDRQREAPGSKTKRVMDAVEGFETDFSISELERVCPNVSRDMIRHVLFQLRDQEKIEAVGRGRGAKWRKMKPDG